MSLLRTLRNRLSHLRGRSSFDGSLGEEIESHLTMRADELVAGGMPEYEARAQARREFGSATRAAEESREAWRWNWLEDCSRDLRYAARALARDRRFTATAILSLALGIGVNLTMFSLATSFLLSEPSVRDPESLVNVSVGGRGQVQMKEFRFLREAGVFQELIGFDENGEFNWKSGDTNRRLFGVRVTDNFFEEMQVPLSAGRPPQRGEQDVAVISHRFWQTHLNGDPNALGRTMILGGEHYTIIGILAPNHRTLIGLGFAPELYVPVRKETDRISLYGRIPAGAKIADMRQRLVAACVELDKIYPDPYVKWAQHIQINRVTGISRFVEKRKMLIFAQFFAMLMIVAGLLLAIACSNVASLLLARSVGRKREFALRLSIGATRGRLIRQLLAESLFLAFLGAAAGLWIHWALTKSFNGMLLPLPVPIRLAMEPDWTLALYGIVVALASAAMSGLLPAFTSTRTTNAALKQGERQVGSSARLRKTVVAAQLAVSVVVLVTAALFVRNLVMATMTHPGFDLDRTIWAQVSLVPEQYAGPKETYKFADAVLERMRATPGVEAATYTSVVPLNDQANNTGRVAGDTGTSPITLRYQVFVVTEDYFRTMGIPLRAGREFTAADRRSGPRLVILNEAFAKKVFGSIQPLGRTVDFGGDKSTVIGVAANSKYVSLSEEETPAIYEPFVESMAARANLSFLIRSAVVPSALTRSIARELVTLDPDAAVEVKPMNQSLGFALLPSRAGAGLLGAIGALGLALAAIGLFGVLSYSVSRRVQEIGLRMALGAQTGDIVRLVLREGSWIVGFGLATGLAVAVFITKPLSMFLVAGLSPSDPITYLTVAIVLIVVGCAACVKPAIRALKADPAAALRVE